MIDNLHATNISSFTSENTIYIKADKTHNNMFTFCQFVSYNPKKKIVTGKVIEAMENNDIYKHRIDNGWEISNDLSKCGLFGKANDDNHGFFHYFNSLGYALDPLEEYKIVENEMHISKHPSFGVIEMSRVGCNRTVLFGASVECRNHIQFTVHKAENKRTNNEDHFSSNEMLLQFALSDSQFASLVLSANTSKSTPCTLQFFNGEHIGEPPYKSKVTIFQEEFAAKMHNISVDMQNNIHNALDILKNKDSITKGDRELIITSMERMMSTMKSSIPYIQEKFKNQMQSTIEEAKAEIEAFVNQKVHQSGIEAIRSGFLLSEENN